MIVTDVKTINSTLLILPSSISDIVNGFSNYKNLIYQIDLSSITGNIKTINTSIQVDLPNALAKFNESQLSDVMSKQPNITAIRITISDANSQYSNSISQFNPSSTLNTVSSFKTNAANMPNFASYIQPLQSLNNSVNSIKLSDIDAVITALNACSNPSGTGAHCPGLNNAAVSAFNTQLGSLTNSINNRPNATDIKAKMSSAQTTINGFPNMKKMIADVDLMNSNLNNVPSLQPTLNSIKSANDSLADIEGMPLTSAQTQLNSFQSTFDALPTKSSLMTSVNSSKASLDQVSSFGIDSYITMAQTYLGYANLSTYLPIVDGVIDGLRTQASSIQSYNDTILNYRRQYLPMVYFYDGYRLMVITIIIGLLLFVPCVSCFGLCCHRKPCCLLCIANTCNILAIFIFIIVTVLIPINIIIGDTCPVVEKVAVSGLTTFAPSIASMKIQQSFSYSNLITVSVNTTPIDMINFYTVNNCAGDDIVVAILNTVRGALKNSTSFIDSLVAYPMPGGFMIHPNLAKVMYRVKDVLVLIANNMLDIVVSMGSCKSINGLYLTFKNLICENLDVLIVNIWLMLFLMGVLLQWNSLANAISYLCLRANWTNPNPIDEEPPKNLLRNPMNPNAQIVPPQLQMYQQFQHPANHPAFNPYYQTQLNNSVTVIETGQQSVQ